MEETSLVKRKISMTLQDCPKSEDVEKREINLKQFCTIGNNEMTW